MMNNELQYNKTTVPYEWNNLALNGAYDPIIDQLARNLPESSPPAPGNKVRLIEMIDGKPYWEGNKIPENAKVPMVFGINP